MLAHFHRLQLDFESIIVFANQADIPRVDLARLSDVGGEMISSLESTSDLNRKLLRRVNGSSLGGPNGEGIQEGIDQGRV